MKMAYADPPYMNCAHMYKKENPNASEVNHQLLINHLCDEFPDGWALSLHTPSLKAILNMCPDDVRVASWVKPFAAFKPNVPIAYAWEPVIFRGGRKRTRQQPTVRDWVSANITMRKGVPGAKPPRFCYWLFEVLNLQPDDEFHDLFPGSGNVAKAYDEWRSYVRTLA